jgi:hypothetical protein
VADSPARVHFREELQTLEGQALGALDLVLSALDRTMEALHHQDIELASIVILDDDGKHRTGAVVEYDATNKIFTNPEDKRTEDYVTGKVG